MKNGGTHYGDIVIGDVVNGNNDILLYGEDDLAIPQKGTSV